MAPNLFLLIDHSIQPRTVLIVHSKSGIHLILDIYAQVAINHRILIGLDLRKLSIPLSR